MNQDNVAKPPPVGELAARVLVAFAGNAALKRMHTKAMAAVAIDVAAALHQAFERPVLDREGNEIASSLVDQKGQFWADHLSGSTVGPAVSFDDLEAAVRKMHERWNGTAPDPDRAVRAVRAERAVGP